MLSLSSPYSSTLGSPTWAPFIMALLTDFTYGFAITVCIPITFSSPCLNTEPQATKQAKVARKIDDLTEGESWNENRLGVQGLGLKWKVNWKQG